MKSALVWAVSLVCLMAGPDTLLSQNKSDYFLKPVDEPIVARSFIVGGPARAISVGFPQGVHLCFDAESPRVAMAWSGDFLDIGPDRGYGRDRGGRHAIPLGDPFPVGDLGFPIRLGGELPSQIQFDGYRIRPDVTFYYSLNENIKVAQTIKPAAASNGLEYHFKIVGAENAVSFHLNAAKVNFTCNKGQQRGGYLLLSSDEATDFVVSVHPRKS